MHYLQTNKGLIEMERRDFFKVCAAALSASVFLAACSQSDENGQALAPTVETGTPAFSKSMFEEIQTKTFSVSHDVYGAIDMELSEVDDEIFSADAEQFSVCFKGPETPVFSEGIYNMYNETLGYIDLYLQPGDSPACETKYRAVFSLLNT